MTFRDSSQALAELECGPRFGDPWAQLSEVSTHVVCPALRQHKGRATLEPRIRRDVEAQLTLN
jgi:hypothetical protein